MKTKATFLFVLLNMFHHLSLAGNKTDSLQSVLKTTKEDAAKVNTLMALADQFRNNDPDKSIGYSHQALRLSDKLNLKKETGKANVQLGIAFIHLGKYDEALNHLSQGLEISLQKNDMQTAANAYNNTGLVYSNRGDYAGAMKNYSLVLKIEEALRMAHPDDAVNKKETADCYRNIGIIYEKQSNYEEALKNQAIALQLRKETGDEEGISNSYNCIGIIDRDQSNYAEAMKNQLAALKIQEETGDKRGMAYTYQYMGIIYILQGNYSEAMKNLLTAMKMHEAVKNRSGIGDAYGNIGWCYGEQAKWEESLKNTSTALKIFTEIGDKPNMALCYNNIGYAYKHQDNYSEAMKNLLLAVKITEEIGNKLYTAEIYESIGETYSAMGKYREALEWINKGKKAATDISEKRIVKESYAMLAKIYVKLNDYRNAYKYHQLYSDIKEKIDEESSRKVADLKSNYEAEKNDREIQLLNKDKEILRKDKELRDQEVSRQKILRNAFISGFGIVLLFLVVVFLQRNRVTREKKRSDELLLNILPGETAEELKQNGSVEAKNFDTVTVMFTDFKNFSRVTEKLSAEELVKEINYCYSGFDKIISQHNIEKIKTIGDSYMCAGGLPVANKTNAEDTLRAALEIRDFMLREKQNREGAGKAFFEIRIGLHTGPVVAGIVGIKKFAYDIWGDTVNIASRMEFSGEVGKVNISGTTYGLVKDKFSCIHRGKIEAKNKGMIDMYFVERLL